MKLIKSIFDYRKKLITQSNFEIMATAKTKTAKIEWTKAMNLLKLLNADNNHTDRLMFGLGFYTGLRISDILELKWCDILGKEEIVVIEGKTKKEREIVLVPEIIEIIKEAFAALKPRTKEAYAIKGTRGGNTKLNKGMSVQGANKRIKKVFTTYEIKTENPSSHTLRKTFGFGLFDAMGQTHSALLLLCEIFGHSSTKVTEVYIGQTSEKRKAIYNLLSGKKK